MLWHNALGRLALGQEDEIASTAVLTAGAGTFAETGKAATFKRAASEAAGPFAETGEAATFRSRIAAAVGVVVETGQATKFEAFCKVFAKGVFLVTGFAAVLVTGGASTLSAAAFVLSGKPILWLWAFRPPPQFFTFTGINALEVLSIGWRTWYGPMTQWSSATKPASIWTVEAPPASSWSREL